MSNPIFHPQINHLMMSLQMIQIVFETTWFEMVCTGGLMRRWSITSDAIIGSPIPKTIGQTLRVSIFTQFFHHTISFIQFCNLSFCFLSSYYTGRTALRWQRWSPKKKGKTEKRSMFFHSMLDCFIFVRSVFLYWLWKKKSYCCISICACQL